jgi:hypothetical protein
MYVAFTGKETYVKVFTRNSEAETPLEKAGGR